MCFWFIMKKILFGELQRYITTQSKTTIITELSHLKHVENSETVQELLAVVCTGLYMFSVNSTELVLYSSRRATINTKWAFTLSRSRKTNCNQTVRSLYSAPSGDRFRLWTACPSCGSVSGFGVEWTRKSQSCQFTRSSRLSLYLSKKSFDRPN